MIARGPQASGVGDAGRFEEVNAQVSVEAILKVAREQHLAGRLEAAEIVYRQIIESNPEHAQVNYLLGVVELQRGDAKRAVFLLGRAKQLDPTLLHARNNLGIALKTLGRLEEAEREFAEIIAMESGFADAYYNRGTILQARAEHEAARRAYRDTIERDPSNPDAFLNLGVVLRKLERTEEAIATINRALELRPGWTVALYNLGVVLREAGRLGESLTAIRAVLTTEPNLDRAWMSLGETQRRIGDLHAAADAFERAASIRGAPVEAHYQLALLRLQLGAPAEAATAIERYLVQSSASTRGVALRAAIAAESGDHSTWRHLMDYERLIVRASIGAPPGYPDLESFNRALAEHVCSHSALVRAPDRHASPPGRYSGAFEVEPQGPIADLETLIHRQVGEYVDALGRDPGHPFLLDPPARLTLTVWGIVLGSDDEQIPRIHPSAWLCGVYYARVPRQRSAEVGAQNGWLEFGRLPAELGCRADPEVHALPPEEGTLLLVPGVLPSPQPPIRGRRHSDRPRVRGKPGCRSPA